MIPRDATRVGAATWQAGERNGGVLLRQRGSHRQYEARATLADGTEVTARTTVAQHAGDVRPGTLRATERDLEPVFGKGWLTGR